MARESPQSTAERCRMASITRKLQDEQRSRLAAVCDTRRCRHRQFQLHSADQRDSEVARQRRQI